MQVTPISLNNQVYLPNVKKLAEKPVNQEVATNPILQNKVMPSAELLKSYVGIQPVKQDKVEEIKNEQPKELSAYDYLLTLPNVKQGFKTELATVAKVMEKMDVESSNTEMMVNLVAEGKLWRGVLRYFCEHGKMSKNMEGDIDLIYNAYAEGKKPIDAYVPTVGNKQDGINSVKVGDTFEVEGEKNIYFKDSDDNASQLKVSKETFAELFPPAERFSGTQGAPGDCYLLATLNTMIENPVKRGVLYDMFEETDDAVNVKIPTGEKVYTAPKSDLKQGIDKWQHMQGATGMILAEHAYGEELQYRLEDEFHEFMNSEIARMEKETFAELFPPAERFSGTQGAPGDCYLLATLNTMIENPVKRGVLYDMFEETDDAVNVKIPTGEKVYTAPKSDLKQGIDKWQHMQGATGMILAEHAYGEELQYRLENEFHEFMNSEIARMEKEEPQNTAKIEGYKQRLADFDEKSKDSEYKPVLMRFENPDANGKLTLKTDENGVMFKDLKSADKEYRRKLSTQADFYRGSIGGDLDVVMRDFGNEGVKEFKPSNPEQRAEIKALMTSNEADKYIFTAGALSDGTLTEKPIAKEYSVYGCHAYKVAPFKDDKGDTKFYVENPWNATQHSVMDFDKLAEFFEIICIAKV